MAEEDDVLATKAKIIVLLRTYDTDLNRLSFLICVSRGKLPRDVVLDFRTDLQFDAADEFPGECTGRDSCVQ